MSCHRARELIQPYIDGELERVQAAEVKRHIDQCKDCYLRHRNQLTLRSSFKDNSLYYRAPQDLRIRIRLSLREEVKTEVPQRSFRWTSLILAVSVAVLLITTTIEVVLRIVRPAADERIAQEIVSDHVRSLQSANQLPGVLSSDQHTIKPWFNGKVDFSPPVNDFAAQDFHLYGGRLDYVNNRTVATLIYQRRSHFINLYIWPAQQPQTTGTVTVERQGYNLVHWTSSGMNFWAISDLGVSELTDFARLFQQSGQYGER